MRVKFACIKAVPNEYLSIPFFYRTAIITKSEFAKGIVSPRQRYRFVVRKDMFEAMKHGLWGGQSLCLAVRKLSFRKMKNEE